MNGAKLGDLICIMGCSVPRPVDEQMENMRFMEIYMDLELCMARTYQPQKTGSWCCETSNSNNDNKILVLEGDFLDGLH